MDFSVLKKLKIGGVELVKLTINGIRVWASGYTGYTNLVPLSTDKDGSIFNGTGYRDDALLRSSDGAVSISMWDKGNVVTGFIPINGALDVLRIKGVVWAGNNDGKDRYICYYDSNKNFIYALNYRVAGNYKTVLTITVDANGIETLVYNYDYEGSNTLLNSVRSSSYVRIMAKGVGADMIVTVNEEITE